MISAPRVDPVWWWAIAKYLELQRHRGASPSRRSGSEAVKLLLLLLGHVPSEAEAAVGDKPSSDSRKGGYSQQGASHPVVYRLPVAQASSPETHDNWAVKAFQFAEHSRTQDSAQSPRQNLKEEDRDQCQDQYW
ncbi:hypothetical protein CSUB01_07886 [Colletotrichum sublineola]|uniref:Uncharacterized protein n=1 Tax=Colletotrichum sublineola TaxID=1173701 RepID=A0A066XLM5_COLSU|nr:hypothetical protein CSUB01_07886 [Colletotrichum sublineola]